jgi:hypothetical protein
MKKVGWGLLFGFMVLLVWNTRVLAPSSAEAIAFDVCVLCLIVLTFLVARKLWSALFPKTRVTVTGEPEAEDDPRATFDLADERMDKNSGWDRVNIYAKRYDRSWCGGGPPSYDEVFEYSVQEKIVYQRLVEKRTCDFFKTTDKPHIAEVKNGVIVEESMKILDAEDDHFKLRSSDYRESLKMETGWHEVHDVVMRYALWATKNSRDKLIAESARLNASFLAVDVAAKKLGGVRDEYCFYKGADGKTDEALEPFHSDEGLAPYGITANDMFEQGRILSVLAQAIDKKK